MDHESPFFILANPRSGSSLLRIICDCNSELMVPPESGFLLWWKSKYEHCTPEELKDPRFLEELAHDIVSSKKFETWNIDWKELLDFITEMKPKSYAEAGSLVYYLQARKRGKSPVLWGDKNNYYIHYLDQIIDLYPKAKFIHLVRDGRDVACSYINLTKISSKSDYFPDLPVNILKIAMEWADNNRRIHSFLSNLSSANHLTIRYEDIICELEASCKKICDFLNVSFDEAMLNYDVLNRKNNLEPAQTLAWKMNTLKKPDRGRIKQYLTQLTKDELQIFSGYAKSDLKKYGYV